MKECICLAYYGDNKFLGWYGDSFGTIVKSSPKIYSNTPEQKEVIRKNFEYKIKELNKNSKLGDIIPQLSILDRGLNRDKGSLSQYKEIELKIVSCPFYDGPNSNFDKTAYELACDKQDEQMKGLGILDLIPGSIARIDAVNKFHQEFPSPKCDNWIYADYSKVKEWAINEPTEFVGILDKVTIN